MRKSAKKKPREKRIDESHYLSGKRRGAILKEEVWYEGELVVKYNLAYINPRICGTDNGRVLGFDNSHGHSHRHFMGSVERVQFSGYNELVERFRNELLELWSVEDEEKR